MGRSGPGASAVRTLASDLGFVEGPTLLRAGGLAVVSLDHQRILALDDGTVRVLIEMDAAPNGLTEGADGTLFVAAFSGAWPARDDCTGTGGIYALTPGGDVHTVTREPQAPNDLCVGPDGCLYVTDPLRGQSSGRIWRVDVATQEAVVLAAVDWYPNGIGFDVADTLWVADTVGRRMVTVAADGSVEEAFHLHRGKPDGFAFDVDGNLLLGAPGTPEDPESTVQVWTSAGSFDRLLLDGGSTHYTNVAIAEDATAYVTESQHGRVLALPQPCAAGLALHPFR